MASTSSLGKYQLLLFCAYVRMVDEWTRIHSQHCPAAELCMQQVCMIWYCHPYDIESPRRDIQAVVNRDSKQNKYFVVRSVRDIT